MFRLANFSIVAGITLNAASGDTFTIFTGTSVTTGATALTMTKGQFLSAFQTTSHVYEIFEYFGGGSGVTCGNSYSIIYGSSGNCDTSTSLDGSGNAVFNSVATVQNYTTVGIANDLTNYPANYYLAKIVVGASPGFSTAVAALTTDPPGTQVYPVASGGGAGTGASDLVVSGETTFPSTHGLTFDGAVTAAGDCVVESTTTAAAAHDTGVSCLYPSTLVGPLWVIGTLRNTVPVTGAQYVVDVHPFFIPGPLATLSEPSQTTGFSGATLCAATAAQCGAAGTYNIHWNIWQSGTGCSSPTNGASLTLTWTDAAGNSHTGILPELLVQYLTSPSLSGQMPFQGPGALGNAAASGDYTVNTNGSAITVSGSNNGGCGGGTATWNVLFTVERKH
jgi:hypothetical protein